MSRERPRLERGGGTSAWRNATLLHQRANRFLRENYPLTMKLREALEMEVKLTSNGVLKPDRRDDIGMQLAGPPKSIDHQRGISEQASEETLMQLHAFDLRQPDFDEIAAQPTSLHDKPLVRQDAFGRAPANHTGQKHDANDAKHRARQDPRLCLVRGAWPLDGVAHEEGRQDGRQGRPRQYDPMQLDSFDNVLAGDQMLVDVRHVAARTSARSPTIKTYHTT
jgi:hypothetical protein